MSDTFDLIVIGNGAAGDAIARGLASSHRVAVIERDRLGGECLNTGCIPSKALIELAHAGGASWDEVVAQVRAVQLDIRGTDPNGGMAGDGIELIWGAPRFLGPTELEVDGRRFSAAEVVVATGTDPSIPPIPGLREANPATNQSIFTLPAFPRRLAVIGAGPIGVELAQAFRHLGAEVTIYEMAPRMLPTEEGEVGLALEEAFAAEGIRVETGASIESVERLAGGEVDVRTAAGVARFDEVLVAAGRTPRLPEGLDALGLDRDDRGFIAIDGCGRTNLPGVWAAGDITGRFQFTHYASYQAHHIRDHIANTTCEPVPDAAVPWAIFTDPEIGHVGPTEEEARREGIDVVVAHLDAADVDWFRTRRRPAGFAKVIADRGTGRLIAAHIISDRASSIIGEATLAVACGLSPRDVASTIHPYPAANDLFRWACAKLVTALES